MSHYFLPGSDKHPNQSRTKSSGSRGQSEIGDLRPSPSRAVCIFADLSRVAACAANAINSGGSVW